MDMRQKTQSHRKPRIRLPQKLLSVKDGLLKHVRTRRKTYFGLAGALLILVSTLIYNFAPFFNQLSYELSPKALELVGEVRDDAKEYLKQNDDQSAYEFVVPDQDNEAAEHTGRVEDAFSANFSIDPKEGISVTEKNTQVSIGLVPKFVSAGGKMATGNQIVYPFGKNQLVYSLKYNGLKEDIIIPEFIDDYLEYEFELILPVGAEARLETNGEIGIYTADDVLFGDISYGSDEDKELVEAARKSSEKTNLVANIPAPIIKDASLKEHKDRSEFVLGYKEQRKSEVSSDVPEEIKSKVDAGSTFEVYTLSIKSTELEDLPYPISIDPTFQITSAADFAGVNLSSGVEIDSTNNLIRRGSLTGGTFSAWTSTADMPCDTLGQATVVSNGYIYSIAGDRAGGGCDVTNSAKATYARINSDGTLASNSGCGVSWCETSTLNTGRRFTTGVAQNGYVYVFGGAVSGGSGYTTTVEYAKILANGELGSWTATASFSVARGFISAISDSNYLYIFGGGTGSTYDYSEYARLNADGSIASDSGCSVSWCANTSLPDTRHSFGATKYNDWVYIAGGRAGGTLRSTVYFTKLNGDGTHGSWVQATSLTSARYGNTLDAWNGYLYVAGGCTGYGGSGACTVGTFVNTTEYNPINADGSLGTWRADTGFTTATNYHSSAIYNGKLYILGGCSAGACNPYLERVVFTTIDTAGALHDSTWSSTTGFTTGRRYATVEVYNGCMYVIGGWASGIYYDTVQYATINADGTVGSWTTSGNTLATARRNHSSVLYGGYLYVLAGYDGTNELDSVEYAAVNADCTIGSFTAGSSVIYTEQSMSSAAYNGYLYTAGGNSTGGDRVQRATIDSSDGSIGTWSEVGVYSDLQFNYSMHIYNGYMYLVGGRNGSGSTYYGVRYAPIASDGTLPTASGWTTATSFTTGRINFSSVIYNGYMYVIAGADSSSTALDDVQLAPINTDGSLGTWSYTTSLDQTRGLFDAVTHNGYLYVVGGTRGATTNSNAVDYQVINNGGQGGPVAFSAGTTFTTARKNHASVVHNGRVYVLGGCTNTGCTSATITVRYATLNANGSVGTWADVSSNFGVGRYNLLAWVYNDRLYIAGGRNTSATDLTDIRYNTILSNGDITGSWTTDDTSLPATGQGTTFALNGNTLYLLGGASTQTTTRYASIDNSTGDISSFSTSTALPEGRYNAWAVAYRNYIYIMGGYDGSNYLRSVYMAPLNGDGTIGTWRTANSQLNAAVSNATRTAAFADNGYLYIVGGEDSSGFYNRVQYAPVGSGGDLGSWQKGVESGLAGHGNYAAAYWSGTVIITAGAYTGNNTSNISRYASLQSIPRIGSFSHFYNFEVRVKPEKLITRGLKTTGGIIGFSRQQSPNCNTQFGNLTSISDLGLGSANMHDVDIAGQTTITCLLVQYVLDDRSGAVFPDTGNQTYISDFDLYFITNPGSRLRGGRSFINGSDRGLQASPQ